MSVEGSERSPLAGRMVFLVGARRSGTNWLHRILGAHPAVAVVPGETHLFSHGIAPLVGRFHHGPSGSPRTGFVHMERDDLHAACRHFCDAVFLPFLERASGAELLVERTPWHVEHLGLIGQVYPDARIVHIVRDGRDVARSLEAQTWVGTVPDDLAEAAAEWRRAILGARRAAPGLGDYREVRYEELFADPRRAVHELYGWLTLPVDDAIVDGALAEADARFNVDGSMPQVTTDKWRLALSPQQVATIESVAGDALAELGYLDPHADPGDAERAPAPVAPARVVAPAPPASVARTVRRAVRVARRLASRARGATVADVPTVEMESIAQTVDEFLDAVHTGDADAMRARTAPHVQVRIVDRGDEWVGRGEAAVHRLASVCSEHGLPTARQRRGDVHPGPVGTTVVLTYDGPGGCFDAAFVLHVERYRIRYATYYRFPLDPGTAAS